MVKLRPVFLSTLYLFLINQESTIFSKMTNLILIKDCYYLHPNESINLNSSLKKSQIKEVVYRLNLEINCLC